jgi:hypothetical protein
VVGGRYRLDAPVGRGGAGVVWRGEDELLQRPVAVKEILVPLAGAQKERDAIRARVLREARALARLHSSAIVTVFDVVEDASRHWIIMELVDAESLGEVIRADGPLSPSRVAAIGLALSEALGAAHSAGVLHRDVKPGNVLLGRDGRVRLTDFGIAATEGDATLTGTGALVGSPAYIAPERVRGASGTSASDLWGLAATLYAAVEGHPPFEGPETYAVLTAVVEGRRRPFQRAGALEPLLTDLLDRGPEQRPALAEIRRRLRPVAGGARPVPDSVTRRPSTLRGDEADNDGNDLGQGDDGREAGGPPTAGTTLADGDGAGSGADDPGASGNTGGAGDPATPGDSGRPGGGHDMDETQLAAAAGAAGPGAAGGAIAGRVVFGIPREAGHRGLDDGWPSADDADYEADYDGEQHETRRVPAAAGAFAGTGAHALAGRPGGGLLDDGLVPLGDEYDTERTFVRTGPRTGPRRVGEPPQRSDEHGRRGLLLAGVAAAVVIATAVALSGILTTNGNSLVPGISSGPSNGPATGQVGGGGASNGPLTDPSTIPSKFLNNPGLQTSTPVGNTATGGARPATPTARPGSPRPTTGPGGTEPTVAPTTTPTQNAPTTQPITPPPTTEPATPPDTGTPTTPPPAAGGAATSH